MLWVDTTVVDAMYPGSMPPDLRSMVTLTYEADRHRGEEVRHALHRGLLEGRVERPSFPARLSAAVVRLVRREARAMTSYPCRLPDGKIGRTAAVLLDGEWTLVCRVA
jgi:hypothetical protein